MAEQQPAAKKSTELTQRVATGLVGATLFVLLIVYGGWVGISLLTVVLSMAMVYEYATQIFAAEDRELNRTVLLVLTLLVSIVNFLLPRLEYELIIGSFLALFIYFLIRAKGRPESSLRRHFDELQASLFAVLYLVFLPLFLPKLNSLPDGPKWTLLFFLMVWAGDSGAYFVGKKYGRRRLYPDISPKKSVEGGLGGLASGVILALLYKALFFHALGAGAAVLIAIFIGVFEQVGDFCESFFKRAYGVKDSGSILPGHGGVLDRFDGVVFSLPVMYACARLFSS